MFKRTYVFSIILFLLVCIPFNMLYPAEFSSNDESLLYYDLSILIANKLLQEATFLPVNTHKKYTQVYASPMYIKFDDFGESGEIKGYSAVAGVTHSFGYGISIFIAGAYLNTEGSFKNTANDCIEGKIATSVFNADLHLSVSRLLFALGEKNKDLKEGFNTGTTSSIFRLFGNQGFGFIFINSNYDYIYKKNDGFDDVLIFNDSAHMAGIILKQYWELSFHIFDWTVSLIPNIFSSIISGDIDAQRINGDSEKLNAKYTAAGIGFKTQIETPAGFDINFSIDGFFNSVDVDPPVYSHIIGIQNTLQKRLKIKSIIIGLLYRFNYNDPEKNELSPE